VSLCIFCVNFTQQQQYSSGDLELAADRLNAEKLARIEEQLQKVKRLRRKKKTHIFEAFEELNIVILIQSRSYI
jgi:hypothetical protein